MELCCKVPKYLIAYRAHCQESQACVGGLSLFSSFFFSSLICTFLCSSAMICAEAKANLATDTCLTAWVDNHHRLHLLALMAGCSASFLVSLLSRRVIEREYGRTLTDRLVTFCRYQRLIDRHVSRFPRDGMYTQVRALPIHIARFIEICNQGTFPCFTCLAPGCCLSCFFSERYLSGRIQARDGYSTDGPPKTLCVVWNVYV